MRTCICIRGKASKGGYRALGLTLALAVSAPAMAVMPDHGIFGEEVSDQVLADMRGKFVDGSQIAFFGVKLSTAWELADGSRQMMDMHLNVDLANQFAPVLTVYHTEPGQIVSNSVLEDSQLANVSNEGLDDASGVVQAIQVAGDGNAVTNDVLWRVNGRGVDDGASGATLVEGMGNQIYQSENGAITQVNIGRNQIGYEINIPGVGRVVQSINGNDVRGLLQSAQLDSNLNRVTNGTSVLIETRDRNATAGLAPARRVLSTLLGVR
ncbi:MAG: hypothetical protein OIF57_17780 [Marinobacterium sp.]|nr:hypothetical protein [Marinobacterium sp.]